MSNPTEAEVIGDLRMLHAADQVHARRQLKETVSGGSRVRTRLAVGPVLLLLGALVVGAALIRPSLSTGPGGVATSSSSNSANTSTTRATPTFAETPPIEFSQPDPSPTVFPSTLEGQTVLQGQPGLDEVLKGTSGSYLIGGWVRIVIADCASSCGTSVLLYVLDPSEGGLVPSTMPIHLLVPATLNIPLDRPIVLEVERDQACDGAAQGCPALDVMRLVWTQG